MPVVQGAEQTRQLFDWLAPRYDAINAILFRPEWRALVRSAIEPGPVLDVGVGTGCTSGHLEDAVGIDLSGAMLVRASRYRGDLVLADAAAPPFRPSSFGTIVCAGSFYYLPDPVAALRTFHALLKARGLVLMISPEIWVLRPVVRVYTRKEYETMAASSGFTLERYKSLRGLACLVAMRKDDATPSAWA